MLCNRVEMSDWSPIRNVRFAVFGHHEPEAKSGLAEALDDPRLIQAFLRVLLQGSHARAHDLRAIPEAAGDTGRR
jgi:hypothetical protein